MLTLCSSNPVLGTSAIEVKPSKPKKLKTTTTTKYVRTYLQGYLFQHCLQSNNTGNKI